MLSKVDSRIYVSVATRSAGLVKTRIHDRGSTIPWARPKDEAINEKTFRGGRKSGDIVWETIILWRCMAKNPLALFDIDRSPGSGKHSNALIKDILLLSRHHTRR
jgi:hypothetical protein